MGDPPPIITLASEYEAGADLRAVTGSRGYLEIPAPGGSAAAMLSAELGLRVVVRRA